MSITDILYSRAGVIIFVLSMTDFKSSFRHTSVMQGYAIIWDVYKIQISVNDFFDNIGHIKKSSLLFLRFCFCYSQTISF